MLSIFSAAYSIFFKTFVAKEFFWFEIELHWVFNQFPFSLSVIKFFPL